MPIILLVDDSDTDRKVMEGLLSVDFDWLVTHTKNGAEALDSMQDAPPDAVVTDLIMPEVDGMELARQCSEQFPDVPVVVVTGQEDASLAFEALRQGAASYVPKSQLADKLLETVEQVLSVRDADKEDERIVQLTTNTRYRFDLENDPALIAPLVNRVQHGMIQMQLCSPTQRMHLGIALEEAIINAMYHGNLELPSHRLAEVRRHLHDGTTSELVEKRRLQEPYASRRVHIAADLTRKRAQFVVGHEGAGFDVTQMPDANPGALEADHGRGLVLIQTFMDEVIFSDTGNEMRMTLLDPANKLAGASTS
ncbi:MAG: response regulator [Planctomycetota bacterium]